MTRRKRPPLPAAVLAYFREPLPAAVLAYFREQGAKGGRIGSKRRLVKLSPEQRSELARKAARARWSKKGRTNA